MMSSRKREQRAWYVYDWANSAFSTTVVTGLFGPYLTELVKAAAGPDGQVELLGIPINYLAVWEWLMALSVATQALAMPLVGAIADYGQLKKPLLGVMAYIGAGATVGMYWLDGERWLLGCGLFLVANLAFGTATLLYNAFLPEISGPAERDAVSSKGWGNKRAVMLALVVWTLLMVYVATGVSTKRGFYLLFGLAGFIIGGSQALSRSIFSFLIPKGEEAQYFSFYEISDKGSSPLGPVVVALVLGATGSLRIGALAIAVFFVAGLGILAKVDVRRGAAAAGNEAPPKGGSKVGGPPERKSAAHLSAVSFRVSQVADFLSAHKSRRFLLSLRRNSEGPFRQSRQHTKRGKDDPMRRMWSEIKQHRLSTALFLFYWLIVFGLDVFRWHKPKNRPEDILRTVLYLHFLLPVIAGALVSWWRRYKPGRITGSMLAGAAVLVLDAAALLTYKFFDFRYWESSSNESIFELPVLLIALGLLGALLGLIGAADATGLAELLDRWQKPAPALVSLFVDQPAEGEGGAAVKTGLGGAGRVIPRRLLRVAGGLAWGAAVVVLFGVIPALAADNIARTAPRAIPAFAVNAILNVLIGIALLTPVSRRSTGAGKVLVVMAGFVSLLLGSALLDAATALTAHSPGMRVAAVACFGCAAGDLGAGVLALIAALRRPGKDIVALAESRGQCVVDPTARGKL